MYFDLKELHESYHIEADQNGEYICRADGILYRFTRMEDGETVVVDTNDRNVAYAKLTKDWDLFYSRSGGFLCDREGRLMKFCPDEKNSVRHTNAIAASHKEIYSQILKDLIIPEGVRQIGSPDHIFGTREVFRHIIVLDKIRFPDSLEVIGSCEFANSCLPEVILPSSLKILGSYTFGSSRIRELTIPSDMKLPEICYSKRTSEPKIDVWIGGKHLKMSPPPRPVPAFANMEPKRDELRIEGRCFTDAEIDKLICSEDLIPSSIIHNARRIGKIVRY